MKKFTSDTYLLAANEHENRHISYSLSQPLPNAPNRRDKHNLPRDKSCTRRSSLLSIPSSFSFTSSQSETPIRVPVRATSTTYQTGQRRMLLSQTGALTETPLVALLQPVRNSVQLVGAYGSGLSDDLNESTIGENASILLLHDASNLESISHFNTQISSHPITHTDVDTEVDCSIHSDDSSLSRFEVLDKTINLHESLAHDSYLVEEEFLTEPFWSESQVESLKNYQNF